MKASEFDDKLKIALNMEDASPQPSEPYISINKLAEYMQANPTRRRQILKNLKGDKDYFKIYYGEVRNVLLSYFKSGYDNSKIDTAIKRIEKKVGQSTWDDADNPNSILALQCLKDAELPDLSDYDVVSDIEKIDQIELGSVKVIVRPEVYLRNRFSEKVGAVKVHIAKTEKTRHDLVAMQYVAVMLKFSLMEYGFTETQIDNNACLSIDIFQKNFGSAPRAYKRSMDALTAACEEIAARWPTI